MEEKPKHIALKDTGDAISKDIAVYFQIAKDNISQISRNLLLNRVNKPSKWYAYQQSQLQAFQTKTALIIRQSYKSVYNALKSTDNAIINDKQTKELQNKLADGFNMLNAAAISMHQQSIASIQQQVIHSNVTDNLYSIIADRVKQNATLGYKTYSNGKNYEWASWMETKVRTDIQNDISQNLIESSANVGFIFYTTSCYGNCAEDHVEAQGKIYVDDKWQSIVSEDLKEQVQSYIDNNKIQTVQSIMNDKPYLTTRPNCRHYFQPITIDEVLKVKTNKQLVNLRDKYHLNFAGAYDSDKSKALSKQRAYERNIRNYQELKAVGEDLLKNAKTVAEKIDAQSQINYANKQLNGYDYTNAKGEKVHHDGVREKLRDLIDETNAGEQQPVLVRSYQREQYNRVRGLKR